MNPDAPNEPPSDQKRIHAPNTTALSPASARPSGLRATAACDGPPGERGELEAHRDRGKVVGEDDEQRRARGETGPREARCDARRARPHDVQDRREADERGEHGERRRGRVADEIDPEIELSDARELHDVLLRDAPRRHLRSAHRVSDREAERAAGRRDGDAHREAPARASHRRDGRHRCPQSSGRRTSATSDEASSTIVRVPAVSNMLAAGYRLTHRGRSANSPREATGKGSRGAPGGCIAPRMRSAVRRSEERQRRDHRDPERRLQRFARSEPAGRRRRAPRRARAPERGGGARTPGLRARSTAKRWTPRRGGDRPAPTSWPRRASAAAIWRSDVRGSMPPGSCQPPKNAATPSAHATTSPKRSRRRPVSSARGFAVALELPRVSSFSSTRTSASSDTSSRAQDQNEQPPT